jgi:hypothetical protein
MDLMEHEESWGVKELVFPESEEVDEQEDADDVDEVTEYGGSRGGLLNVPDISSEISLLESVERPSSESSDTPDIDGGLNEFSPVERRVSVVGLDSGAKGSAESVHDESQAEIENKDEDKEVRKSAVKHLFVSGVEPAQRNSK